jgi:hypothetical protein
MNTITNIVAGLGLAMCASLATMMRLRPDVIRKTSPNPWAVYVGLPILAVACLMILATSN